AFGTVETAVEAMKLGAYDYITKPFSMDELKLSVEKALDHQRVINENVFLRSVVNPEDDLKELIGQSDAMKKVFSLIRKVAPTDTVVLLRGESGTGKEIAAKAIHDNSRRSSKPFIATSCAVYAEGVLESELFGHEKGSFTGAAQTHIGRFELASGGTLFLDEIGDIAVSTQVKLLRVLQEKQFERVGGTKPIRTDVRIIAATNKDLEQKIKDGTFREDLYFRLNVFPVVMPPLRERKDDIVSLSRFFMKKYAATGKKITKLSPEAVKLLEQYRWPGNVRE